MNLPIAVLLLIIGVWLIAAVFFREKPNKLTGRNKVIAWLLFMPPFMLNIFRTKLTNLAA